MSNYNIEPERIHPLNDNPVQSGQYVLYWMQQSQRAEDNHALEYAVAKANELDQPVIVAFGLMDDYPDANLRHYYFMLQGLQEVEQTLKKRKIKFLVEKGHPADVALKLGKDASSIVCDKGYLKHQKAWRSKVSNEADCEVTEIESDLIVPVEVVSGKAEYAARTIRPKIHKHLEAFLKLPESMQPHKSSLNLPGKGLDLSDVDKLCNQLKLDRSVPPVPQFFNGGTSVAKKRLSDFIEHALKNYTAHRNQAQTNDISHMSMYLHFGQISPIYIINQVMQYHSDDDVEAYVEELLVRRELAANYCYYNQDYDAYKSKPEWALKSLEEHKGDDRAHVYTRSQLENAETHDEYWNACMREMRFTGFMHNYMRMYWGKKILEWTNTPEYAFKTTLEINNKYFLDGRDCNSYTNVSWIFGTHDRAWQERPIIGKVRSMTAGGLKRKMDIDGYVKKVDKLVEKARQN